MNLFPEVPDPPPPVVSPGTPMRGPARALLTGLRMWTGVAGRLAPSRLGPLYHRLYFTPPRLPPSREEASAAKEAVAFEVPFKSPPRAPYPVTGSLPAWRWGTGKAVLMVHGWGGRGLKLAARWWRPLTDAGFSVVAFDGPGHGTAPGRRCDLLSIATAVEEVAKSVGPLHAIVAHSLGISGAMVALDAGLHANAFVGIGGTAYLKTWPSRFSRTLALPPSLETALYAELYRTFPEEDWDTFGTATLAARMKGSALFVHDREDVEAHWTNSVAIARRWPNAELMVTEGMGHYRILTSPDVISRAVSFLDQSKKS